MDSRGNCGGDSSSGDCDEDDVESAAEVAAVAAGMIEAAEETLKEDGDGLVLAEDMEDAEEEVGPSSAAESLWEPMVRHYIHMNLKVRGSCTFSRERFCSVNVNVFCRCLVMALKVFCICICMTMTMDSYYSSLF